MGGSLTTCLVGRFFFNFSTHSSRRYIRYTFKKYGFLEKYRKEAKPQYSYLHTYRNREPSFTLLAKCKALWLAVR